MSNILVNFFNKIKSKSSQKNHEYLQFSKASVPKHYIAGVAIDVGLKRKNNEDSLFSLATIIDSNGSSIAFGIFMVADGMGGHKNGEIASELAIRIISNHLMTTLFPAIYSPEPYAPKQSLQEILKTGFSIANEKINQISNGGGTTLTAVLAIGTQITIAHVGDSRAYSVYLDGRIVALTKDHSLVSRLVEMGQLTEEEAANHPHKSTLISALGQRKTPNPDIVNVGFPDPGYLLICSDGLWGAISEDEISKTIRTAQNPQQACQNLVDAANSAGGPDNIAVVLVKLSD